MNRKVPVLFLLLMFAWTAALASHFDGAGYAYVIKVDDETIWGHKAERKLPQASLTKIMTALIAIESGRLDEVVTVPAAAAAEKGSRLKLRAGDRLLLKDLLAAAVIKSANDASHAIAAHLAGDEKKFAAQMNRRAKALGLKNTRYANASGLDQPEHYSTAGDTARLMRAALRQPLFRQLLQVQELTISTVDDTRSFELKNTNRLMGTYEGLVGGKTGFTAKAGPCLVVVAEREGKDVTLVMLNAPGRWKAAPVMFDSAFERALGPAGAPLEVDAHVAVSQLAGDGSQQ
jgi:serine-type D-Ala-D-Ala carboxypeptidase (penicillin-binding protein 5/6)